MHPQDSVRFESNIKNVQEKKNLFSSVGCRRFLEFGLLKPKSKALLLGLRTVAQSLSRPSRPHLGISGVNCASPTQPTSPVQPTGPMLGHRTLLCANIDFSRMQDVSVDDLHKFRGAFADRSTIFV